MAKQRRKIEAVAVRPPAIAPYDRVLTGMVELLASARRAAARTVNVTPGQPVVIVDYDPRWPRAFSDLSRVIGGALGELALSIEHVGSTAVPGLAAKPVIDIDVVIASEAQLPAAIGALASLGYVYQGDLGIPQRQAFRRQGDDVPRGAPGGTWPEHNLYVCCQGSRELQRHLAFRDFLRANPAQAAAYGALKRQIAEKFRNDRDAYVAGKTEFIEGVLRRVQSV